MRNTPLTVIISCLVALGLMYAVETAAQIVLIPTVSIALLAMGMVLIISQFALGERLSTSGVAGTFCLGLVVGANTFTASSNKEGILILLAGVGLLLVETFVYSGHGISAFGGVSGIFAGLYMTLVATTGPVGAIVVAALVAILAFVAFLAYLPHNHNWRAMTRKIEVSTGRSQVARVQLDKAEASKTGTVHVQSVAQTQQPISASVDIVERMKARCSELRVSSVPIIANQLKIDRSMADAKAKLEQVENEARVAANEGRDDLAKNLLMQREDYQTHVTELSQQQMVARIHAEMAKQKIEDFRRELQLTCRQVKDAQVRGQLAAMIDHAGEFTSGLLDTVEGIEARADAACAEAEAYGTKKTADKIAEFNARKTRANDALLKLKEELRRTPQDTSQNQQIVGDGQSPDRR